MDLSTVVANSDPQAAETSGWQSFGRPTRPVSSQRSPGLFEKAVYQAWQKAIMMTAGRMVTLNGSLEKTVTQHYGDGLTGKYKVEGSVQHLGNRPCTSPAGDYGRIAGFRYKLVSLVIELYFLLTATSFGTIVLTAGTEPSGSPLRRTFVETQFGCLFSCL
jgi:hypothetical protein